MGNRWALVTGSTRGIGGGIAQALAEGGCNVVLNSRRKPSDIETILNRFKKNGVEALYIRADISEKQDRDKIILFLKEKTGRLDVLVNNAGVAPLERKDILEVSEESYDRILNINAKGPFFLTQAIAVWMRDLSDKIENYTPQIINITSISAYTASVSRPEYCISKAAMSMLTKLFAVKLAGDNIGVYEIRPGIILTDMTKGVKAKYDKLIGEGLLPIRRWGTPDDVARAVAAIASGSLPYSTGAILDVDGGFHLKTL